MKKICSFLLVMFAMLFALPTIFAEEVSEASYVIETLEDLTTFRNAVNNGDDYSGKVVKLENDLTLTGEWTPIGGGIRSGNTYNGTAFKGIFDGNNKTISGLTISTTSNVDYGLGLFGVVDGGTVKNLHLTNVNINVATSEVAGGAIGILTGDGIADAITVSGTIAAKRGNGGIVGRMLVSGTISNSINNANLTATGANLGGIVGAAYYTAVGKTMTISNCTNNGSINSTAGGVGGIVGLSAAHILNCTNNVNVLAKGSSVGGIAGEQQNYGSIINCVNKGNVQNDGAASSYGTGGIVGWIRYSGAESNYPLKGVVDVIRNINQGSVVSTGADAGGIIGVVYHAAEVRGNENSASTLSATTFAAGIVGSFQCSDTFWGDPIPQQTLNVIGNVSSTTIDNISVSALCKHLYVYDNTSGNQDGLITLNANAWLVQTSKANYVDLQLAINEAESGDTIKLLANIELTSPLEINKDVVLDLNSYTISSASAVILGSECNSFLIKGGNYSELVDAISVAENHVIVNTTDTTYLVESEATTSAVAKIGNKGYLTLEEAFKAVTSDSTVTILKDVTIDYKWDNRYTGAKFTVPVTINGDGHTLTFTDVVYDGGNFLSAFRFEADAVVKDLTFDMTNAISGFQTRIRAIAAKANLTVDGCTFIGNGSANNTRAIIVGESAGAAISNINAVIKNSEFINWRRGISDNENAQDVNSFVIEGNTFTDASVGISASGNVTFNDNKVSSGEVKITSYTAFDTVLVTALNNTVEDALTEINVNPNNITSDGSIAVPVAMVGSNYYFTLEDAIAAAGDGGIVNLCADLSLSNLIKLTDANVTIAGDYNLKLNDNLEVYGETTLNISSKVDGTVTLGHNSVLVDSTINGEVFVAGSVLFRGANTVNMIYDFGKLTDYYGTEAEMAWTIEKGSSLKVLNKARYGLGYGDNVTIYGDIKDALSAREALTEGDVAFFVHGIVAQESLGWNQNSVFTVKDAYVVIGSNNSFGNKPGNYGGTYQFVFENTVLDASRITFYEAKSKTEFTFNNSDVMLGVFMTNDEDSVFKLVDSKIVATTPNNGTNEGNYNAGALTLENSSISYGAPLRNNGIITLDLTSLITASAITGTGKFIIDANAFDKDSITVVKADMSGFTGTIEIINKPCVEYAITSEGIVIKEVDDSKHKPALAVEENRVESTCTVAGSYDSVVYCSDCNKELSRETKALELLAHTASEAVEENRKASTCKVAGSYDQVVYCSDCNFEMNRTKVELPLAEHKEATLEAVEATCATAGLTEGKKCSVCGEVLVAQQVLPMLSHNISDVWEFDEENHWHSCIDCDHKANVKKHKWGNATITKEPTTDSEGEKVYTCECGAVKSVVINKIPADYQPDDNLGTLFGCGGSVMTSLIGLVTLTGFVFISRKRKED